MSDHSDAPDTHESGPRRWNGVVSGPDAEDAGQGQRSTGDPLLPETAGLDAGEPTIGTPDVPPGGIPQQSLLRRLAGGTGWLAMAQTLPLVFNLVLTPFIIHGLGVGIYGIFLLVAVIQQFIGSVDGGVGPSARRYFGIYSGRGDRAATTSLLVTLLVIVVAASVLLFGVLFLAAPNIMAFFPGSVEDPEGSVFLLRIMILLVALAQARGLFTQVLWTSNKFHVQAIGDLLGFFAYAGGMVLTVQHGYGLVGVAWSLAAQQVITTFVVMPSALRLLDRRAARFVPRPLLKEFFTFAWKIQVSGVLSMVSAQGDAIFVGKFAAPQLTAFGTGSSFANTLKGIPTNASAPMEASIVRAIGASGVQGAAEEATSIQRLWVRVVSGWIAVGAPAAYFGVTAWLHLGTDLPGQVAAVVLLSHGVTMLLLIQRFWLNALGRSGLTLAHDVINTVVNLTLTFPLILSFGAVGTITATLVAALVAALYLTLIAGHRVESRIPTPWSQIPWVAATGAAGLALALCWTAAHFLTGPVVPFGPLSLLTIGIAAAPALLGYFAYAVGVRRLKEIVAGVMRRRG